MLRSTPRVGSWTISREHPPPRPLIAEPPDSQKSGGGDAFPALARADRRVFQRFVTIAHGTPVAPTSSGGHEWSLRSRLLTPPPHPFLAGTSCAFARWPQLPSDSDRWPRRASSKRRNAASSRR